MANDVPSGLTQSVSRALRILRCFSDATPQLRVSDISEHLDLTPSLVSRVLSTMEHEGFVERDVETGFYRIGPELITLAGVSLNHNRLRVEAVEEMHQLSNRLRLGVNLSVLYQDAIFYLAHIDGPDAPRAYTLIGRHNPLHATGMGKVLLAFLPEEERATELARLDYHQFTRHTITDRSELERELGEVSRNGWAAELEELALGRGCVAGPIRDRTGEVVAALSISGPLSALRWEERRAELVRAAIETTDLISRRLGYITAPRTPGGGWRSPQGTVAKVGNGRERD
jgi:DNA-binding IclR family transcriptional regulator